MMVHHARVLLLAAVLVGGGAAAADTHGPVTATDTLWSLAERFRPDETVSVQRMMLALLEANPEAFSTQNVNALQVGAVLRIPTREEIGPEAKAEALAEVRRQHAAWDAYGASLVRQVAPAPERPAVRDAEMAAAVTPEAVAPALGRRQRWQRRRRRRRASWTPCPSPCPSIRRSSSDRSVWLW